MDQQSSRLYISFSLILLSMFFSWPAAATEDLPLRCEEALPSSDVSVEAHQRAYPRLSVALEKKGLTLGNPIFIRIFKSTQQLEVWIKGSGNRFSLFKSYAICHQSGTLGPKTEEGDRQSPEGFYTVTANQMNPWSKYHLSFNLGYPNEYDRAHERTGSALMVHGRCSSIGCFAMTDYYMDEIYTLAETALAGGQAYFQVHIFPFPLTPAKLAEHKGSPWIDFWQNLGEGYRLFEQEQLPPIVGVVGKRYVFHPPTTDQGPGINVSALASPAGNLP